jgi:hypothetical protein
VLGLVLWYLQISWSRNLGSSVYSGTGDERLDFRLLRYRLSFELVTDKIAPCRQINESHSLTN